MPNGLRVEGAGGLLDPDPRVDWGSRRMRSLSNAAGLSSGVGLRSSLRAPVPLRVGDPSCRSAHRAGFLARHLGTPSRGPDYGPNISAQKYTRSVIARVTALPYIVGRGLGVPEAGAGGGAMGRQGAGRGRRQGVLPRGRAGLRAALPAPPRSFGRNGRAASPPPAPLPPEKNSF
jgi:hypothetical protein